MSSSKGREKQAQGAVLAGRIGENDGKGKGCREIGALLISCIEYIFYEHGF